MVEGNIFKIRKFSEIYLKAIQLFQKELRRLLKNGVAWHSAHWLAWNFAIKPAIKDLKNILCSIAESYKKMKWLQDHNHHVVRKHYARSDIQNLLPGDVWNPDFGLSFQTTLAFVKGIVPTAEEVNGLYVQRTTIDYLKIDYVASSELFLEIPDQYLDSTYGIGVLWSTIMGLTNPVGIGWEATPWSWLIDYFLGVRSRLFQTMFTWNPYNEGVTVTGLSHSYKIIVKGNVQVVNTTHNFVHDDRGRYEYTLYVRTPGLPFCEESDRLRVPNDWYHFSIIGAIIGQWSRRH